MPLDGRRYSSSKKSFKLELLYTNYPSMQILWIKLKNFRIITDIQMFGGQKGGNVQVGSEAKGRVSAHRFVWWLVGWPKDAATRLMDFICSSRT